MLRTMTCVFAATVGVLALAWAVGPARASGKGAVLARSHSCTVCHKQDLDGRDAGDIVRQLEAFRSGERTDPKAMARRAEHLSDDDIKALADYFAGR